MTPADGAALQILKVFPKSLITFRAGGGVGPATVKFRIETPDSRLRTKISVSFVPEAGGNPISGIAGSATLWLYEAEDDEAYVSGIAIPSTNIEGTFAAPTAVPATAGLYGYSREFSTAADAIEGIFTANGGGPIIGTWVLKVRYQPAAGQRFTDREWDAITRTAKCNLIGRNVVVP